MSKLVLLWLTLLVWVFFNVWKEAGYSQNEYALFPYSDQLITIQTYVWIISIRFIFVVMAWIILQSSDEYRFSLWVFFWINVFKLIEFFFNYNGVWVYIWDNVPVTSNILSALIFGISILYESIYKE